MKGPDAMGIQLSATIESDPPLLARVQTSAPLITELLPATARAFWDMKQDDRGRTVLTLALSDPFGYAATDFAPEELDSADHTRRRVHELVAELVQSVRRERIEIRDAFVSANQIADFQQRLNSIPEIVRKRPKLYNRVQSSPGNSGKFLITDFAVEVDADVAELVKQAIRDSGFNLRGEPILSRHGIKDRVRELVQRHCRDGQATPRYAVCFNLQDPVDLHLLEIADDAPDLGEGSLEGVGFAAGDTLPGARSIVLYLATPAELRLAARRNPNHPAIRHLREGLCWFVHPDDGGAAFNREFADLLKGSQ